VNYRHAFHAGNFADTVKHALLVWLLRALARKPAPFALLDTHAGIGRYDLGGAEAERTGEWRGGIGRLRDITTGPLADYLALVRAEGEGRYPGSPALAQRLLRAQDRLILVELHEADAATLRRAFRGDARIAIHRRDGFEAARALTPFAERRGLVLLDPPFEAPGEFERLAATMRQLRHRARSHIQAAWYPVKHRAPVRGFHTALRESGLCDVVAAELWLREPTDPQRLNGCGLAVVNPPFGFAEAAGDILAALLESLSEGEAGEGFAVARICDE
jgi:23S rRNA (adenine2030-N6)-methyltransferase